MGFTADGLPLVGNLTGEYTGRTGSNEWIAAGFNGHGMDKCWLTGQALAAMVLGEDAPLWFPTSYLVGEERLRSLTPDAAATMFANAFLPNDAKI